MNGKESGLGAGVTSAWNERMRLIRLRRKKEQWRFRDELKLIPKWLVITVAALFAIAEAAGIIANLNGASNNGVTWPSPEHPVLSSLAIAGLVAVCSLVIAPWILMVGYVNRDAKRRGMNSALWTLLCIVLMPAYLAVGFIIYFLVREPLPYPCPKCGSTVGPRFNFCPSCRCDLRPSCPNCKREIVESDKFCANCGHDLATPAPPQLPAANA